MMLLSTGNVYYYRVIQSEGVQVLLIFYFANANFLTNLNLSSLNKKVLNLKNETSVM